MELKSMPKQFWDSDANVWLKLLKRRLLIKLKKFVFVVICLWTFFDGINVILNAWFITKLSFVTPKVFACILSTCLYIENLVDYCKINYSAATSNQKNGE